MGDGVWATVSGWLSDGPNVERVHPPATPAEALAAQFGGNSTALGAVLLNVGYVSIDDGWLRLLGSGTAEAPGPSEWATAMPEGSLTVAHDVLGGVFALNLGAFAPGDHSVWYFAPDTLSWETMDSPYSAFVEFVTSGDLATYYGDQRWDGWQAEVRQVGPSHGFSLNPPLWSVEGKDPAKVARRPVPMTELWAWEQEMVQQLGPAG